jgi:drug/metabolite transporter (DMT)-like permease
MRYLGACLIVAGAMFTLLEAAWLALAGAQGLGIVLGLLIALVVATPLIMVGSYLVSRRS